MEYDNNHFIIASRAYSLQVPPPARATPHDLSPAAPHPYPHQGHNQVGGRPRFRFGWPSTPSSCRPPDAPPLYPSGGAIRGSSGHGGHSDASCRREERGRELVGAEDGCRCGRCCKPEGTPPVDLRHRPGGTGGQGAVAPPPCLERAAGHVVQCGGHGVFLDEPSDGE
jgi:hypothetical protein